MAKNQSDRPVRLSVALCTYNGASYLEDQLRSIAMQTRLPGELVVGDDGSTDATVEILNNFALTAPFPVRIFVNSRNLGFADNFLETAARCSGDWIIFSDQDDRWYPDKVERIAARISQEDVRLVVHPLDRADGDGQLTGEQIPGHLPKDGAGPMAQSARWHHGGCGLAFDTALMRDIDWRIRPFQQFDWKGSDILPKYQMAHDFWISLLGNLAGPIGVIDTSLGIFRRHSGTVTGTHLNSRRSRIRNAVGVEAYRLGETYARDTAEKLGVLAAQGGRFSSSLTKGRRGFERIADNESARAKLYAEQRFFSRLVLWYRMVSDGTYFGDPFAAVGRSAMVKDLAFSIACYKTHGPKKGPYNTQTHG